MKKYLATLNKSDADLLLGAINNDTSLYPDSCFKWVWEHGQRLECYIAPNDMRIFIRLLLEMEDEDADSLVQDICGTLGIEEIWLNVNDFFFITLYEEDDMFGCGDWELLALQLGLPYVSCFDEAFWPLLFEEALED